MAKRKGLFSGIGKTVVGMREGMFDAMGSLNLLKESTKTGAKLSKKKNCYVDFIDGNGQKVRLDAVLSPSEIVVSVEQLGMLFFTRDMTKYYDLDLEKPCFICYNNWHETVDLRDESVTLINMREPNEKGQKIIDEASLRNTPVVKHIQSTKSYDEWEEILKDIGITCKVSTHTHPRAADFTRKMDIILSSKWVDQFDDVPSRMILMSGIFGMLIGMLIMAMTLFAFMR